MRQVVRSWWHCLLASACVVLGLRAAPVVAADWVYMDLGEVVVTGNPTEGYTYVPGVWERLQALKEQGFRLALLTNIPESWGAPCLDKYHALQDFLGSRLRENLAFDWQMFDAVVVPPFDRYRKPQAFMFVSALANACQDGQGRSLFIGEEAGERQAAEALGMASYWGPKGVLTVPSPQVVVQSLDSGYRFRAPEGCDFSRIYQGILLPQDRATGIAACVINP